ncbi:MAG: tyrosine-type recombinase/integrase, partial [Planctomycetaceae bacterium]|nr:tyrosine-type recombinase/integrase [Planctomycetaceae bacterium]
DLTRITPAHVGNYLDGLSLAATTKKLHLSALRNFFDQLVLRHVIILNPALSVRCERVQITEGKTPAISIQDARKLLDSMNITHIVGLRDRAIIGTLAYTAVRASAVAKLTRNDFYHSGDQYYLNFDEKNGKNRTIPVRHDLQRYLLDYLSQATLDTTNKRVPLFRSTIRRTQQLTDRPLTGNDILRICKRRLRDASLSTRLSPHSFRVTIITDLLEQNVPLEEVQYLAGHADPRTTRLYDRRKREVTRNLVERISI